MFTEVNFNENKKGKITAIIPVRSGSVRCQNKNIRPFGDTNLLKRKIEVLKQVPEIDDIIVTSNDEEMLDIALKCGVKIDKRESKYANSQTPNGELHRYLGNLCKTPIMLYVTVVSPFVPPHVLSEMINIYRTTDIDNVMATVGLQQYLYQDGKAINYNPYDTCNSQTLKKYDIPIFNTIIDIEYVRKYNSMIGKKPYFYELKQLEGIDIDTPYDFMISELLYKNNIHTTNDIINQLSRVDNIKTELLDCTIRDGGYVNNWNFTDEYVKECYKAVSTAGYDYFEVGFVRKDYDKKCGKWYSTSLNDIINIANSYNGCKLAVMLSIDNNRDYEIPDKHVSMIELYRLHVRIDSIGEKSDKILDDTIYLFNKLKEKGYEVCLNLASSDKFDNETRKYVINKIGLLDFKCIYVADTFGNLDEESTGKILTEFQNELYSINSKVPIAFHPHNNMTNAVAKSKIALNFRVKILDSTIYGLGRGAGNLQSELLIMELNKRNFHKKLSLMPIINFGDKWIRKWSDQYKHSKFNFGNNVLFYLSGYFNIHPDYVNYLFDNYPDVDITVIYHIFELIKMSNTDNFDKSLVDTHLT